MDISTINQIIESGSIIIASLIVVIAFSKAVKWKFDVKKEIILLKDILFFRNVIDQYCEYVTNNNLKNNKNKFREIAGEQLDYKSSTFSKPSEIKKRLEELSDQEKSLNEFIQKI